MNHDLPALPVRAPRSYGPWLVALGAALWGTESAWRIPLNDLFSADVIVFYEHVILVVLFLPLIVLRLRELPRTTPATYAYLAFSGVAGSAVGTVLFTLALREGNPTVINVILNLQPVLSTAAAYFLFRDRLAPQFFVWAPLAILSGMALSLEHPGALLSGGALSAGTGLALLCALCWGLSTVAGRGVMVGMSLPMASGLRVVVGLLSMSVILAAKGEISAAMLWPPAAQAAPGRAVGFLLLLSVLSGGVPLLFYFAGLRLTRASTAGYFEMMQTLAGAFITWWFFGHPLLPHQLLAGGVLVIAVALLSRAQRQVEVG